MRYAPLPKAPPLQLNNETPGTIRQHKRQSNGLPLFFYPKHNHQKFLEPQNAAESEVYMEFFNSAIEVLQTLVVALGAGLGIWGVINLLEGYGNDNPGAKSQGMKQLMAGGGVALIGMVLVPLLSGLFG